MRAQIALLALLLLPPAPAAPQQLPRASDGTTALTVTAVEEGSELPIEGVTVEMAAGKAGQVPVFALKSRTNADGQLTLAGIAPGSYRVVATPPERFGTFTIWQFGPESKVTTVDLRPGESPTLRLVFKRPPTISGRVQTPDGKPAPAVSIEAVGWSSVVHERPVLTPVRTVTSDAAGRFTIDRLTPGQYYLRARPSAPRDAPLNFVYAPGTTVRQDSVPLLLHSGDDVTLGLTLRMAPTVSVSGRIVNARGEPAAGARVTLAALDRTSRPMVGPGGAMNVDPELEARTDANGGFAIPHVLQGLYAVRAVERQADTAPITAAGVAEVEVDTSDVTGVLISLAPAARLSGRFVFNGAEEPDPARTLVTLAPDGEHEHLRAGLATSDAWHADGQFEVDGIFGPHRLILRSSGAWYVERATLEDGTDIATYPFAFAAGRVYRNVRVWLSDRVASVTGPLPSAWDAEARPAIVAFPEDPALRTPGSRHVRMATVSKDTGRFSVLGLPPGQVYLIAAFEQPVVQESPSEPLFQLLTPTATRVVIDDPRAYDVAIGPVFRR